MVRPDICDQDFHLVGAGGMAQRLRMFAALKEKPNSFRETQGPDVSCWPPWAPVYT